MPPGAFGFDRWRKPHELEVLRVVTALVREKETNHDNQLVQITAEEVYARTALSMGTIKRALGRWSSEGERSRNALRRHLSYSLRPEALDEIGRLIEESRRR